MDRRFEVTRARFLPALAYKLFDWQRGQKGKKFLGDPEKANARIADQKRGT